MPNYQSSSSPPHLCIPSMQGKNDHRINSYIHAGLPPSSPALMRPPSPCLLPLSPCRTCLGEILSVKSSQGRGDGPYSTTECAEGPWIAKFPPRPPILLLMLRFLPSLSSLKVPSTLIFNEPELAFSQHRSLPPPCYRHCSPPPSSLLRRPCHCLSRPPPCHTRM